MMGLHFILSHIQKRIVNFSSILAPYSEHLDELARIVFEYRCAVILLDVFEDCTFDL